MKSKIISRILSATIALITAPSVTRACSVCLTDANDPTADAFNWSVIFLMATPYTVVGSIAGWLVYTYRRSAAKQEKQQQNEAAEPLVPLTWNAKENGR
jgi:heme/copper-type cytochrome/quinol oxidase subunit 2